MFSLLKNATRVKAVRHLLLIVPHPWQWCRGSVRRELGVRLPLLGRGFSTLAHVLALPWMFNGRLWWVTYPVLRCFGSLGAHAVETQGGFGPWRSDRQRPALGYLWEGC